MIRLISVLSCIAGTSLEKGFSVLGWNHPGFGGSTGTPFPQFEVNAADAVMQFALERLGFVPEQIIIHGWSIGDTQSLSESGPFHSQVIHLFLSMQSMMQIFTNTGQNWGLQPTMARQLEWQCQCGASYLQPNNCQFWQPGKLRLGQRECQVRK